MRLPRVLSPQTHRRVDLLALPSVIASVAWMSRQNSRVAALMSMIAAVEAAALLTTEYSPGSLRGTLADGALPRVRHYRHPSAPRWRSAWQRRPLWQAMGPRCLFRRSNGQNTMSTRKGGRTYDGRASRGAGKDDLT